MAVYAKGRGRDTIWQGFWDRRTNALTGDNIHLLSVVNGVTQGGIIAPVEDAALQIEAVTGGFIDSIDLIRNGRLWHRISPEITPAPLSDTRSDTMETVLYLELGWGARRSTHHWQGSLHIEGGEILSVEPRFRGADVVSPLEGQDGGAALPVLEADGQAVRFAVTAEANPNNFTSASQGIALRLRLEPGAVIRAHLSGQDIAIAADRLFEGAKSGNLGAIDTPAWRFHAMPRPHQWQWAGNVPLGALAEGENLYLRLRQAGGQMAWTSPIFCRSGQDKTNQTNGREK